MFKFINHKTLQIIRSIKTLPKFNFTVTKSNDHYDIRITQNKDIDEFKKDISSISGTGVHLSLNPKISGEKFKEFFNSLANSKLEEFHVDITDITMDDEKVDSIKKCLTNWNLKHLEMHLTNLNMNDKQFSEFLEPIKNMKNLYFLHLEFDNVNLTRKKREIIDDVVKNIPSLRNVYINIRKTEKNNEDYEVFKRLLDTMPVRSLLL
jgi:hypothetical protein